MMLELVVFVLYGVLIVELWALRPREEEYE